MVDQKLIEKRHLGQGLDTLLTDLRRAITHGRSDISGYTHCEAWRVEEGTWISG